MLSIFLFEINIEVIMSVFNVHEAPFPKKRHGHLLFHEMI